MSHFHIMEAPSTGAHLIDASAGTGKTYTISGLVVRMIVEHQWAIEDILVVTFTEAAASDLKFRIREMITAAAEAFETGSNEDEFISSLVKNISDHKKASRLLGIALQNFDEAPIFTIHGFCQRVLQDNFLECGQLLESELVTEQWRVVREISEDFFRRNFYESSPLFVSYCLKRFLPENLRSFLGAYFARDDMRIIPQVDRGKLLQDIEEGEDSFVKTLEKVKTSWKVVRGEVERIFLENEGLNRRSYPAKNIPLWLAAFDAMAALPDANIALFDSFHKFTNTALKKSMKKGCIAPEHDFFDLCDELLVSRDCLLELYEMQATAHKQDLFGYVRRELEIRKEKGGYYTFDDMLKGLSNALKGQNGAHLKRSVASRYRAALIDEFQDTDPLQYEIFNTIFAGQDSLLLLIGDPKQAIYSFRGADIFAYLKAVRDVESRYTLGYNWRSVPSLINAINAVFSNRTHNPFIFKEILFESAEPAKKEHLFLEVDKVTEAPFQLVTMKRDESEEPLKLFGKGVAREKILAWTAHEISRLISLGNEKRAMIGSNALRAGDIAVLSRTNREARLTQKALADVGVASVLHSTESLFASREAEELLLILKAVAEPADTRILKAALATRIMGLGGEELDMFDDQQDMSLWVEKFRAYHDHWLNQGFGRMFNSFISRQDVCPRLLKVKGGERVVTNLLHMYELLHRVSVDRRLGVAGLCKYLLEAVDEAVRDVPNEHQLRLESDAELVQIVTIHKSKGLQYPIVFCPFCWEGSKIPKLKDGKLPVNSKGLLYHDKQKEFELTLDIGSSEVLASRNAAFQEELAENIRLLYVALTRAVQRCYLFWGPIKDAGTSAPAYFLHQGNSREKGEALLDSFDILSKLTDDEIADDLLRVVSTSEGSIELRELEVNTLPASVSDANEDFIGECLKFTGNIDRSWKVLSYTSLAEDFEVHTTKVLAPVEHREMLDQNFYRDIKNFPRGAAHGTFLHSLLEGLDFTSAQSKKGEEWVCRCLVRGGYDEKWQGAICSMLSDVLCAPLKTPGDEVCLVNIERKDRLDEMEFYFPLDDFDMSEMAELLGNSLGIEDSVGRLSTLGEERARGFMKGYIDLVFYYNGRFHIVDWKSNHLGYEGEDYLRDKLEHVMIHEKYMLQYHIYTVALHRYLKSRMPEYEYEKHFGGVHYLFLRGIDCDDSGNPGVYDAVPDKKTILEISDVLSK